MKLTVTPKEYSAAMKSANDGNLREYCKKCIVAHKLQEHFGADYVEVSHFSASVYKDGKETTYLLSNETKTLIDCFDYMLPLRQPCEIEIYEKA